MRHGTSYPSVRASRRLRYATLVTAFLTCVAHLSTAYASGQVVWNTFLGGSAGDYGYEVAVDGSGNTYVVGYSEAAWGSPVRAYSNGEDGFVAKLSPTGELLWSTFLGGASRDNIVRVAVDDDGNVFVAGFSEGTWGLPVNGYSSSQDGFVAKLDSSGMLLWSTFIGGLGNDVAYGIGTDAGGNVLVAGYSSSAWGAPIRAYGGSLDAFVVKLNSSGAQLWSTFLGSGAFDECYGLAVDEDGNSYIAGGAEGSWGSPVRPFSASRDAFVAKIDAGGAVAWNTFLGSAAFDYGKRIVVGASGVYVTGRSDDGWGSPVDAHAAGYDAFAAKLDTSGTLLWNTFVAGRGGGLAVHGDSSVLAGASNFSWGMPARPYAAGSDGFTVALDSVGQMAWNTFLGGPGDDEARGTAIDSTGNVYATGESATEWGSPIRSFVAGADVFVARLGSLALSCGDGTLDAGGGEQCDDGNTTDGDCCSSTCAFEPSANECRSAGECDIAEHCTGTSAGCPSDGFQPVGTPCASDGNACTDDQCDGAGLCTHPNNTALCDDGLFCTATDGCSGGLCVGSGDPCMSGGECTSICNEFANNCLASEGTPCGDLSTNACSAADSCDGMGTCRSNDAPAGSPCNDGLFCTANDVCSGGACGGSGTPCVGPDGDGDCAESCNESADNCLANDPDGSACSGGTSCTLGETCNAGVCSGGSPDPTCCDDGNACTQDTFDPDLGDCLYLEVPATTCRIAGKSALGLSTGTRGKARWKFGRGEETTCEDFGNPQSETSYDVCIYDGTGGGNYSVAGHFHLPPSNLWSEEGDCRWTYSDRSGSIDGITGLRFRPGEAGRTSLQFSAGGPSAPIPTPVSESRFLTFDPDVTVQIYGSNGECWSSQFLEARKNTADRLKTNRLILVGN